MAHKVPAVYDGLFGSPNKKMHSIFRASKPWWRFCVEMECSGMTYSWGETEPPAGGEADTDLLCEVQNHL
jgi:hypothetical protein